MKHPGNLLVDAHVHYYSCFPRALFLESARRSFRSAAARLGLDDPWTPFLMLTESRGHRWFRRWREEAARNASDGEWHLVATGEEHSLCAVPGDLAGAPGGGSGPGTGSDTVAGNDAAARPDRVPGGEGSLVIVAGRQTATRDGLEVLGLGRDHEVEDGAGLEETVEAVLATGALPVIPWGFGKWWGGRGRRVEELLRGELASRIFLGDNAGRPGLAPPPRLFRLAAERDVPVLPGSDPLPFRRHASRAGSYGFLLRAGAGDETCREDAANGAGRPATRLLELLATRPGVEAWGDRAGPLQFARDQVAMQVVKRRAGPRAS